MVPLFDLDVYKNHLIAYYCWPCDKDKRDERAKCINRDYSDDYLRNILTNTQNFISMLLKRMENEQSVYKDDIYTQFELPMLEEKSYYISNNCGGGWPADQLFYIDDQEKALISIYLLKIFFGTKFRIYIESELKEHYDEMEETGCEYYIPIFSISGPLIEFDRIYDLYDLTYNDGLERKEKQKSLLSVLKQISNKKQDIK